MNDEFDDDDAVGRQMREVLSRHAQDAPRTDLTDATLTRARRIRARRRVAVGTAAVAVAAVLVPVGALVLDDSRNSELADRNRADNATTNPTGGVPEATTRITLSSLRPGDAPAVPYLVDGRLVRDGQSSEIAGVSGGSLEAKAPYVVDAVSLDDGIAGYVVDPAAEAVRLEPSGASILPSSDRTGQPAVDDDGSIAYAVKGVDVFGNPVDASTIVYASALSEKPGFAYTTDSTVVQVMDVTDGAVLFNAIDAKGHQFVGSADMDAPSPAPVLEPYPRVVSLSAADQSSGLMVGRTTAMNKHCNAMLSTQDASELWTSCTWRPTEFSPDGSKVFAVRLPVTGPIKDVAVLDAASGRVERVLSTDGRFGRATFEAEDRLDIVTVDDGLAAIVRCSTEGACELATGPEPARPGSLAVPYQITANP